MNKAALSGLGWMLAVAGCGGGGNPGDGGSPDGSLPVNAGCSELFNQGAVASYGIDIAPADWDAIVAEFKNVTALAAGEDFATYHPVTFHAGNETVAAAVKLHGQSSWLLAAMFDGDRAKMQFTVSFEETDPEGKFHGVSKLIFDMPRSDWTFLHDRMAQAWLRQVGIMAPCSTSAELSINGQYYGLFTLGDNFGRRLIKQYFPNNAGGDIWKGGEVPSTDDDATPNWDRKIAFWNAMDLPAVTAIVDLPASLRTWAAEALLNDADGYYGGFHNFYLYDQGRRASSSCPRTPIRPSTGWGRSTGRSRTTTRSSGGPTGRRRPRSPASTGWWC